MVQKLLKVVGLLIFLSACQKTRQTNISLEERTQDRNLINYSDKVGADPKELLRFTDSLWRPSAPKTNPDDADCLRFIRGNDSPDARNQLLSCLSGFGLAALSKSFLEGVVGEKITRLRFAKKSYLWSDKTEGDKTLMLLNWLSDLALEQYDMAGKGGYWLLKSADGRWHFAETNARNAGEFFPYEEGDLTVSIGNSNLSTVIPQFVRYERRLTHVNIYKAAEGLQGGRFIEAHTASGVRALFEDQQKEENYYEYYVMRYNDPRKTAAENAAVKHEAATYAESKIGEKYSFSADTSKGYFCTLLIGCAYQTGITLTSAFYPQPQPIGFKKVSNLFPSGFSILREGLSRIFAGYFGVDKNEASFPAASDFMTVPQFDVVAAFVNAQESKTFADRYAFSQVFVDALDRGSELLVPEDIKDKFKPLYKQREFLTSLLQHVRIMHGHTALRKALQDNHESLESIDKLTVPEFRQTIDRLDKERENMVRLAVARLKEIYMARSTVDWNHTAGWKGLWGELWATSRKDPALAPQVDAKNKFQLDPTNLKEVIGLLEEKQDVAEPAKETFTEENEKFDQIDHFIKKLSLAQMSDLVFYGSDSEKEEREKMFPVFAAALHAAYLGTDERNPVHRWFGDTIDSVKSKLTGSAPPVNTVATASDVQRITEGVRAYASFLLTVPSLKRRIEEYKDDDMEKFLKLAPYLASSFSNETLTRFAVFIKLGDVLLFGDKNTPNPNSDIKSFADLRRYFGIDHLWQTPPWVQYRYIDKMLKKASEKADPAFSYR